MTRAFYGQYLRTRSDRGQLGGADEWSTAANGLSVLIVEPEVEVDTDPVEWPFLGVDPGE